MLPSNALHLLRHGHGLIRDSSGTSVLLPVDLCRLGQRKLLLCHHPRMEPWIVGDRGRLTVRGTERRVGGRAARDEGHGYQTDLEICLLPEIKAQPSLSSSFALFVFLRTRLDIFDFWLLDLGDQPLRQDDIVRLLHNSISQLPSSRRVLIFLVPEFLIEH